MEVHVAEMHLRGVGIAEALTKFAVENHICLGAEELAEAGKRAAIDIHSGSFRQAVTGLMPKYWISLINPHVLSIRPKQSRHSWLDYRVRSFKLNRVSLYFASTQLFLFVNNQAAPGKGYLGSAAEPISDNYVGPVAETDSSIRQLLSLLVAESKSGGLWLTRTSPRMREPLPPDPFWTVVPFGGSLKDASDRLRLSFPE